MQLKWAQPASQVYPPPHPLLSNYPVLMLHTDMGQGQYASGFIVGIFISARLCEL